MISVNPGSTLINQSDNDEGRFYHVSVDSESQIGTTYYVTVDSWTGRVLGCSCPQAGLFPYRKCKHQKAVIKQRLLDK